MRKDDFLASVEKETRRLERARENQRGLWHYLVSACSIGWMVVIPALGGTYLGRFIDHRFDTGGYWTLSFMLLGFGLGIFWVWHTNRER